MKYQINERAALLDRAVINGIRIEGFEDFNRLLKKGIVKLNKGSVVDYIPLSGQEFSSLSIKGDPLIDRMIAGAKIFGNERMEYCSLSTAPKLEEGTNFRCYSAAEFIGSLNQIQEYLIESYGIYTDFSNAKLKEIEINRTFKLNHDFRQYYRIFALIFSNLPNKFSEGMDFKKYEELPSIDTYYARTAKKDQYLLFKIYDKSRSLEGKLNLNESYARVELRIAGANRIKTALGTNMIAELTDEKINNYFNKQIQKLVIDPYKRWKKQQRQILLSIMKEEMELDLHRWQVNTLLRLANTEIKTKQPVLLDINELIALVPDVVQGKQRRYRVKHNFRNAALKQGDIFVKNDDAKMQEIIRKIMRR